MAQPENLLLSSHAPDAQVRVADFGFARRVGSLPLTTPCFTMGFAAPEVLRQATAAAASPSGYGPPCDMWSCGVVLYTMLAGRPPFSMAARALER